MSKFDRPKKDRKFIIIGASGEPLALKVPSFTKDRRFRGPIDQPRNHKVSYSS